MRVFRLSVRSLGLALFAAVVAVPSSVRGQSYFTGVAVHAGSLGVGADFALQMNELLAFRAGFGWFPTDPDVSIEDVDYESDLPNPQYTALLDFHPGGSYFRFTGGILVSPDHLVVSATPTERVTINDTEYAPEDIGTLFGEVRNRNVAPYVGIGYGKPGTSAVGFFAELGAAFHGRPRLQLEADGPIADVPSFQANLEADREEFEDDASWARVYPILKIGFSFGVL